MKSTRSSIKMTTSARNLITSLLALSAFVVLIVPASAAKATDPAIPWSDLKAELDAPDSLIGTEVEEWKAQCLQPFVDAFGSVVSNYNLAFQPSGLCMGHASCIYENCTWSYDDFDVANPYTLNPEKFNDSDVFEDIMNIPGKVIHPKSIADLTRAIQFTAKHEVGISVKVAGHSYFGASTVRDSLLVKMTSLPKYAIEGTGLVECKEENVTITPHAVGVDDLDSKSAFGMACKLAQARGKQAVLRVGGGEIFDEAYRAVSFNWNSKDTNLNKYHLLGGGAGTVSAAGGWMASGGLSGTTGMRMYGMGIDQVLHIEMVLPSGTHVRFGPSEWEEVNGFVYPKTTNVTGYCNSAPFAAKEEDWAWEPCEEDVDFNDLWFAVRGGGGGSFGIVTSVYYQLHDDPGGYTEVYLSTLWLFLAGAPDDQLLGIGLLYTEFILKFFFNPSALGVSAEISDFCGSAMTASFSPYESNQFFCYGEAGEALANSWKEFITNEQSVQAMQAAGLQDDWIEGFADSIFTAQQTSYAHSIVNRDPTSPIPVGRLLDNPPASVIPLSSALPEEDTDLKNTHFPADGIVEKMDELIPILTLDALLQPGKHFYALGGKISISHDQTTSLSPTRRSAGFLKAVVSDETREQYLKLFYGNTDNSPVIGDDFPGSSCHNHALVFEMGPLKSDWSVPCKSEWSQAKRAERCISQNLAAWGTKNLARLEAIKTDIDPFGLFVCTSGIGYDRDLRDPERSQSPTMAPTAVPTAVPTALLSMAPSSLPSETPTESPTADPTATTDSGTTSAPTASGAEGLRTRISIVGVVVSMIVIVAM